MLSKVKMYQSLAEIMKYHHEHYDGTGYPYGFKKDEIPIESHVLYHFKNKLVFQYA